ncbi:MAG: alpha-glucan family phosphorylase [Tannerellaceae bacterium]|jgi:starch phosphorylase|nr:alpha-glucan family phosphorylase [Tannerellaceae bacterium]
MKVRSSNYNTPAWKEIYTQSTLPEELESLGEIAGNLWWVWNDEARELFIKIDAKGWEAANGNPVLMLQGLSVKRMEDIIADRRLMEEIRRVYDSYREYMSVEPDVAKPSVAYFSMEYGLSHVLKIYSGGLGVLAGDYLKEASDSRVDLTAVGFLYRYGYFTQSLAIDGQQIANYEPQNFSYLPISQVTNSNGEPILLEVPFPGRIVYANVWKASVGRVPLYLMDTDITQNSEWDRSITHQLYGGDWENRMKQEYMLGIGGILLLKMLGIRKQVYHCNEGHAALINAQRLVDYISDDKLSFNEALEVVRASSLYTVHTPVPAGHDYFEESLIGRYMGEFPERMGITWQEFIDMGRENPGTSEKFSMSVFALNTCQEANGVSLLHGHVSRRMFAPIWHGYFPEELHVTWVTNGVHMPTWAANEWKRFYYSHFGKYFINDQSNPDHWENIYRASDEEIWNIRQALKNKLVDYIKAQFEGSWLKNQGDPSKVVSILEQINPNALFIGFGRRFATYKRAHLLFTDLDRLSRIVNNEKRPIQFIFTGKAHPADGGGQGLIKHIIEISRRPEFLGKIIFLENYDMRLARRLISGVDVWLNTPTRPLEASGTSGEKAQMNGVLNFSVLDGWWFEGYKKGAGWALTDKRTYENQQYQDQLDAATIYQMLENEIIPLYYARNSKGYSPEWVQYIKNSIAQIAPHYTMKRMLDDYVNKIYLKLASRSALLTAGNYAKAREIAAWKEEVAEHWDSFTIESFTTDNRPSIRIPKVGYVYTYNMVINRNELRGMLGAEMVVGWDNPESGRTELAAVHPFALVSEDGPRLHFELKVAAPEAGLRKIGYRVFPLNNDLPHRMDFAYVRWITPDY